MKKNNFVCPQNSSDAFSHNTENNSLTIRKRVWLNV